MSLSVFTAPPPAPNEPARARAVLRADALRPGRCAALEPIVAEARRRLRTAMAIVTIIHEDRAHVVAATGFDPGVYRRENSFCGHAVLTPDRLFVVGDAAEDERFAGNPFVDRPDGVRFYAAAPLAPSPTVAIGTLCVFDPSPRTGLAEAEAVALRMLAQAALRALTDGAA